MTRLYVRLALAGGALAALAAFLGLGTAAAVVCRGV